MCQEFPAQGRLTMTNDTDDFVVLDACKSCAKKALANS